jgi:glutathione S-transferase
MILHHIPFSRSFRVLWMLEELGLEAELRHYAITDGSLRAPDYLAKAPLGRVPALEWEDGTCLSESGAILQLVAEQHPEAGLDRGADHPERGRYLEGFGFAETMGSQLEMLNMQHLFLLKPEMRSLTVMKLNTARLRAAMKVLEAQLKGQEYVLASGVSALDMMMGFNISAAPYYVKLDEFPNLAAYQARLAARPAYQRARAKDGEQSFYTKDFYPLPEGV